MKHLKKISAALLAFVLAGNAFGLSISASAANMDSDNAATEVVSYPKSLKNLSLIQKIENGVSAHVTDVNGEKIPLECKVVIRELPVAESYSTLGSDGDIHR